MSKIIVCDDSLFARKRISKFIEQCADEILHAVDGEDVLGKIEQENPDLIILDLLMPKVDGIGVLKALRERNNSIPVIVLSADIQSSTKEKVYELGADYFLNKPPSEAELVDKVNELLNAELR